MSLLLVFFATFSGIILGKYLFKCWFNHLSIYSLIMGGLTFFYELKFLPYPKIVPLAWFYIISSFLSYLFGILTIYSARDLNNNKEIFNSDSLNSLKIFWDDGKTLKYAIIFFSLIGLFVALHRWSVLINKFGSISSVFLNAGIVYRMNVNQEIKEFIPFLPSFVYVGVFLSGIYSAYKGKFSFLSFFPIICIIIKELTYFGRGEMLFSTVEFIVTFYLTRKLLKADPLNRFKFSKKNAYFATILFIALIITAASFVKTTRGVTENYNGVSKEFKEIQDGFFISPSVYLYLSSDIGVFSKYIELEKEKASFGQNTFRPVYEFLSRLKLVEKPNFFQKGYFIPMWTNTGTYLRELHADFGTAGVFIGPYLLGLLITYLWFKFYQKPNLYILMFLVYMNIIVFFSFLMIITRLNQWLLSQILILLFLPILEKISSRKNNRIIALIN